MNYGNLLGFTQLRGIASGESYPQLKVLYVPSTYPAMASVLNSTVLDTVLLIDSPSATTLNLGYIPVKEGAAIHVAQWGAEQVTISAVSPTLLRVADGLTAVTRAQYSVISLIRTSIPNDEWIVFGDLASA